jgi:hypothetical protein
MWAAFEIFLKLPKVNSQPTMGRKFAQSDQPDCVAEFVPVSSEQELLTKFASYEYDTQKTYDFYGGIVFGSEFDISEGSILRNFISAANLNRFLFKLR